MIPKVSIIIPVYNVSKFIERCAVSLFEQTFDEIEYIFVNDCTPDNSIELLKNVIALYSARKESIIIIQHEINKGVAAARNTGLDNANGNYILNVDSDDYIELDMIEQMYLKAIETDADLVVCDFLMQWKNKSKVFRQSYSSNSLKYTNMLLSGEVMPGVNKLIRKALYVDNKLRYIEGVDLADDYLIVTRLSYYAKVISKVDKPFYHYVQNNENSYTKNYSEESVKNVIKALSILNDFFIEKVDKEYYIKALFEGRLKKKIMLLVNTKSSMRPRITNLYPETNAIVKTMNISMFERLSIMLAKNGMFLVLDIFLFFHRYLIELIQIVKGRRSK